MEPSDHNAFQNPLNLFHPLPLRSLASPRFITLKINFSFSPPRLSLKFCNVFHARGLNLSKTEIPVCLFDHPAA